METLTTLEQPIGGRVQQRLLSTNDTCLYLGVSRTFLSRLVRAKILRPIHLKSASRFDTRDLDAWIEKLRAEQYG